MKLQLERPIVFFDLETTGTNVSKDRIVEIYAKKLFPDGDEKELYQRINPDMQVPDEAAKIHGLTNEILAFEPYFEDVSEEIAAFFTGSDIGGYNVIRFDVPLLIEEFLRNGLDNPLENANIIDSMAIFYKMVPRTLSGAMSYYKNKELANAHSAKADVLATIEVFEAQMKQHEQLPQTTKEIERFSLGGKEIIDFAGYLVKDRSGDIVFSFGKNRNKKVTENKDYLQWMLDSDFPIQTKRIIQQILDDTY